MKNHDLKAKYRLLVLMDMTEASYIALKKAVNLAKALDGGIEVFQVKPPTDVSNYESQISAMRAVYEERNTARKKLKDLANLVSQEDNIPIICNLTFGNVKIEIRNHLENTRPDIVVLGKRRLKFINFLGDRITRFLLTRYSGAILIVGEDISSKPVSRFQSDFREIPWTIRIGF
jgi:nucleotide-binding universal stress UspA family protein